MKANLTAEQWVDAVVVSMAATSVVVKVEQRGNVRGFSMVGRWVFDLAVEMALTMAAGSVAKMAVYEADSMEKMTACVLVYQMAGLKVCSVVDEWGDLTAALWVASMVDGLVFWTAEPKVALKDNSMVDSKVEMMVSRRAEVG